MNSQFLKVMSILSEISGWIIFSLLVFMFELFTHLYCHYDEKTSCKTLFFAFSSIICYTISLIFRALSTHYWRTTNYFDSDRVSETDRIVLFISGAFQTVLWHLANGFVYILFLNRLFYGFVNTRYAVSKAFRVTVITIIIIYILIMLTQIPYNLSYFKEINIGPLSHNHEISFFVHYVLTQIIDLVISISLLVLFVKRLRNTISRLYDRDSLDDANPADDVCSSVVPRDVKQNVSDLTAKALILSSTMIISTQITRGFSVVYQIVHIYVDYNSNLNVVILMISYLLRNIDCFINSLCVFLLFKFTSKYYNVLCGKCHKCATNVFDKQIENAINNHNKL